MIALLAWAAAAEVHTRDLRPCEGTPLPPGTEVLVHYVGTVQGAEAPFDASRTRDRPARFTLGVGELIPGWEQGMEGMSPGCLREIVIPPALAYGPAGRPPVIPPDATLVFEVELLETKAGRAPPLKPRPVPGWTTLDSGLQVHDFTEGTGPRPEPGQEATVEYTLWLPDGTRIDSSYSRPGPFRYRIGRGQVIRGWEEAVQGMKVGGERQFRVPWQLGYGAKGSPPRIPGRTDLVFEVRLLGVE